MNDSQQVSAEQEAEMDERRMRELGDVSLQAVVEKGRGEVRLAQGRFWAAQCEVMVRQVKAAWPNARYLALFSDIDEVAYWNLEAVQDASGGVIANSEFNDEEFEGFLDSFMSDYGGEYADWFTVDERPYFDLEARRPLSQEEHDMNVTALGVQGQ